MIRVSMRQADDQVNGFRVDGHSNYGEHGKDIVCSAVSTLAQTLLITLKEIYADECHYIMFDGHLEVHVSASDVKEVQLLFRSFTIGILAIVEEYPGYVKLGEPNE